MLEKKKRKEMEAKDSKDEIIMKCKRRRNRKICGNNEGEMGNVKVVFEKGDVE